MVVLIAAISAGIWMYLVFMVRIKKVNLFHGQVEPKIAERRLKMLKAFLLVAGISFAVFIVGVVLHNALYALYEKEEPVFFFIAIFSVVPLAVGTIGGLVIFLIGRRKTT
ncbi:hypothetical protein ACFLWS_05285 [Chloroflexota bacterium]